MPYAMVLPLQRTNEAPLPAGIGEYTHAAFFDMIGRAQPDLAARLHALTDRKPFTLGPLQEERKERRQVGGSALLRVTFLNDELFPLFAGALLTGGLQEGLRIDSARFLITGLLTTEGTHPLAGNASYAQLHSQNREADAIKVQFSSPTAFRSQGKDALFPEPRHVWQSWIRTWNAHVAPNDTEQSADTNLLMDETHLMELVTRIHVENYDLQTNKILMKEGAQTGFVGACFYSLRGLEPPDRRAFLTLAEFAFYAGTGRKTTMGMGQTLPSSAHRP